MSDLARQSQSLGTRPALVLVDMTLGFTDPGSPLGCASDEVVTVSAKLLDAFRTLALPIFFTTVCYRNASEASVFRRRLPDLHILTPGSRWITVDPRLAPLPSEVVIEKKYASGFFDTSLKGDLVAARADSIVMTGLTTSGCVRATAVDALQHDYPTFVVSDAVADRNPQAHAASLYDLDAKYADVIASEDLLRILADSRLGS